MNLRIGLIIAAAFLLIPIFYFRLRSALATRPTNLGAAEGKLRPCPTSPNCVSSFDGDKEHGIPAISYVGTIDDAKKTLKSALAGLPRTQIITEKDNYLHAECTSLLMRYVDDVEFLFDDAQKKIEVRSASRVGHSDLGVNRARVEIIRQSFVSATKK